MMSKEDLVVALLHKQLSEIKVGIIVKGVDEISPEDTIKRLSTTENRLYVAAIGYDEVREHSQEQFIITDSIEKAVLWRSMPECAGKIIVFIRNDTDKLHSLAEFDVITTRDIARFLIEQQISSENNAPTNSFWTALRATSDYYTFEALHEFVQSVVESGNSTEAIPRNMWRLNLLQDVEILGTKIKPEDRLAKNRDLIFAIGQLSEDSRKNLVALLLEASPRTKNASKRLIVVFRHYTSMAIVKHSEILTLKQFKNSFRRHKRQIKKKKIIPENQMKPQECLMILILLQSAQRN